MLRKLLTTTLFLTSGILLLVFVFSSTPASANGFTHAVSNVWNFIFSSNDVTPPTEPIILPPPSEVKVTNNNITTPSITPTPSVITMTDDELYNALSRLKKLPDNVIAQFRGPQGPTGPQGPQGSGGGSSSSNNSPTTINYIGSGSGSSSSNSNNFGNWRKAGDDIYYKSGNVGVGALASEISTSQATSSISHVTDESVAYQDLASVTGTDGFPRIVYNGENDGHELHFIQCLDATCSSKEDTTLTDGEEVYYPSIAMGTDGFARIAYYSDNDNSSVKYVQCLDDTCSTKNINTIEINSINPSIAIGSDGFARIAYSTFTNQLHFANCTNDSCSSVSKTNLGSLDNSAEVHGVSMDLGSDNLAKIAYFKDGDLLYGQCANASCTSFTTNVVESEGSENGLAVSVDLNSAGLGRIAYSVLDADGAGEVRVAVCADVSCSSSTVTAFDNQGSDYFLYPNIRVGTDGFARIAFNNRLDSKLKLINCQDISCGVNKEISITSTSNSYMDTGISTIDANNSTVIYVNPLTKQIDLAQVHIISTNDVSDPGSLGVKANIITDANIIANHNLFVGGDAPDLSVSEPYNWSTSTIHDEGESIKGIVVKKDADGIPNIAYYGDGGTSVKFVHCDDTTCANPTINTIDTVHNTDWNPQRMNMDLSSNDGFARIVYGDTDNGVIKFAQCTDATCSNPTISTIANTSVLTTYQDQFISMALDQNGLAYVTYFSNQDFHMKLVRCTNEACSTPTTTTLPTPGASIYSGMTIGNDNFPRIALDEQGIGLFYFQCTNADCSTNNNTLIDDSAAPHGHGYRSIAMTSYDDGGTYSQIAYLDSTTSELRYISCNELDCSDFGGPIVLATGADQYSDISMNNNDGTSSPRITYRASDAKLHFIFCYNMSCSSKLDQVAVDGSGSNDIFQDQNEIWHMVYQNENVLSLGTNGNFSHTFGMSSTGASGYIQDDLGVNGNIYGNGRLVLGGNITSSGTFLAPSYNFLKADSEVGLGSSLFSITSGGNVGIGTSDPQADLHILDSTGGASRIILETPQGSWFLNSFGDSNHFSIGQVGVSDYFTLDENANINIASLDLGDGEAGPILTLGRNVNETNTGAGSIDFPSKDGTNGYVWQDAAGNLRINTDAPSNANDTSGTIIGALPSTRNTKQDIADYTTYGDALSLIVKAPLHTFRYIKDVQGYGSDSPLAKTRIGFIADEVDPQFMVGNIMDQVSINGLLMASVKALNLKVDNLVAIPTDGSENSFLTKLVAWLGDAANGIVDFFANKVHTETLCVGKGGDETCITKDQLDNILQNTNTNGTIVTPPVADPVPDGTTPTDTPPSDTPTPPADPNSTPPDATPPAPDTAGTGSSDTGSIPPDSTPTPDPTPTP